MTRETKRPLAARPAGASKDLLGGEITTKATDPAAVDPGTALAYGGGFAPQHVAKLVASGISPETKHARHYTTVTEKATLQRAQFSAAQRRVPGILIPLHGTDGKPAGYQYRPDNPRLRDGKPVKYESRSGKPLVIDVPPACQPNLNFPDVDLWITEGPLKADAAATAGLCCIALLGVYGFRGRNVDGGVVQLADWDDIALNGRRVVMAFDSDSLTNPKVWDALTRLAKWLERRNASVDYLHLHPTPDGAKVGIDDALGAGVSVDELEAMVTNTPGPRPVPEADVPTGPDGFRYTDVGNAERLVAQHGDQIRYVPTWGQWLCWDGSRWVPDPGGVRVMDLATDVPRQLLKHVPDLHGDERKALVRWGTASEKASGIDAMVRLARPCVQVDHAELDADPWTFNVENCTLDLRAGQVVDHDPERLMTKVAKVRYDPDATAPTWDAFLARIMPDPDLRDFLQLAVGYSLTGMVGEQVLFLLVGDGANGKSTFVATITRLLGGYAATAPKDLLLATRYEPHPTGMTVLHGARFVSAVETEAGSRLAEAQVKQLTGGDTITARRMRQDHWQFEPTHKLWLAANHTPRIAGEDHAIWRRIRLVPFTQTIPPDEQDSALPDKLKAELPGILNWAVEGCLRWQDTGLTIPTAVAEAVAEYRADQDWFQRFVDDKELVVGDGGWLPAAEITEMYRRWCSDNNELQIGGKAFGQRLRSRGCVDQKRNGTRGWSGVHKA